MKTSILDGKDNSKKNRQKIKSSLKNAKRSFALLNEQIKGINFYILLVFSSFLFHFLNDVYLLLNLPNRLKRIRKAIQIENSIILPAKAVRIKLVSRSPKWAYEYSCVFRISLREFALNCSCFASTHEQCHPPHLLLGLVLNF